MVKVGKFGEGVGWEVLWIGVVRWVGGGAWLGEMFVVYLCRVFKRESWVGNVVVGVSSICVVIEVVEWVRFFREDLEND